MAESTENTISYNKKGLSEVDAIDLLQGFENALFEKNLSYEDGSKVINISLTATFVDAPDEENE